MSVAHMGEQALAGNAPSKAWLRALERTASIPRQPDRVLPSVIAEVAALQGDAPALMSDLELLTYADLQARINQYARWALDHGLAKGGVICLMMTNRPEYFAIWLGLASVGVVVSLLNTNLVGASLAHSIQAAKPTLIVVSSGLLDTLTAALPHLPAPPPVWVYGPAEAPFPRLDREREQYPATPLLPHHSRTPTIEDRALYIYTSGTTGLPKAALVSHGRVMQWSQWFAGMMNVQPNDRMYNCLPMYHSVGGVQAVGAMLVAGGSVVIRDGFSATRFWHDIERWQCSLFQYIGELCRYLLHAGDSPPQIRHGIRLACGNGLAPEIWEAFKQRFNIPQILEFYASTEGSVSLFNAQGKPGAIGHIPPYLTHRFSPALVQIDPETGEPVRDERGLCILSAANQPGEALGKIVSGASHPGSRFEGYTSIQASQAKVLRNVLEVGDSWFRTGDLMRKDEKGFYYFVDRVGDTFRRKGENVSTTEVAERISRFPAVRNACVYGVKVPGVEGRVGMAALVLHNGIDLALFRKHLVDCLPAYARPVFLRIRDAAQLTGTFKYAKADLQLQGYDPAASSDRYYFDDSIQFIPIDNHLYRRIQQGEFRL